MKKNKGFTLIELLVVIAIIAILSTVVMAALSSQKSRARISNAQKILDSVKAVANACMSTSTTIDSPASQSGGGNICGANSGTWPTLPTNWVYYSLSGTITSCHDGTNSMDFNTSDGNFRICAFSVTANDNKTVVCSEEKCTLSTYNVAPL